MSVQLAMHELVGVLDAILEGFQIVGPDWRYLHLNETAARHGRRPREELLGRTMMECYPGIERTPLFAALQHCMATRTARVMENEFRFPDGTLGWFELRIEPVPQGLCVLSIDVTERRRAAEALRRTEETLRHAQKMEAVGRLAGGIAHDFNNLLSVVLSYSEMFLARLRPEDPLQVGLSEILKAGRRAATLTRQLLAFSRHQVMALTAVDLGAVVAGMHGLLRRVLGEDIELTVRRAPDPWTCRVDPSQMEHALMNLAVNAREAMPRGGKLTLETANVHLDPDHAHGHPEVAAGSYVMLSVTDTGCGMDRDTQARLFEPFFTTKPTGQGTGLGLATVFGIVKQFHGHIWVYSEPGQGTCFRIYLPRMPDAGDQAAPGPAQRPTALAGTETVLLVEDDEQVREVAIGILRSRGYHVLAAANAAEALLLCERHGARIHLLLTDVVLPRMSGRELAQCLLPLRPGMQVLYMSGYDDTAIAQHGVLGSDAHLLQKPFTPDGLALRVRKVLDGATR